MRLNLNNSVVIACIAAGFSACVAPHVSFAEEKKEAKEASSFQEMFTLGTASVSARYRYEMVDEDAFVKDANASTLRTRLGIKTARYDDFDAVLEFEDVHEIGHDNFNNTLNGKTDRPTVADVESTEINQSYLSFYGIPDSTISFGRKTINLDNERFVGEVGWRQNNQTFDAATVANTSISNLALWYGHFFNVNRIVGDDSPVGDYESNSNLFNLKYSIDGVGNVTPYAYLLDFHDQPALSSASYGARFDGKAAASDSFNVVYDLEYAYQSDYQDNPTDFAADYWHASAGVETHGVTLKGGYEVLGSDSGVAAFQTPLATLHKWNGWADKFLTTPVTGLQDAYVGVWYKASGVSEFMDGFNAAVVYHDFKADEGSADYGTELDVEISRPFLQHYQAAVTYARYDADEFGSDTDKLIFSIQASFNQ